LIIVAGWTLVWTVGATADAAGERRISKNRSEEAEWICLRLSTEDDYVC